MKNKELLVTINDLKDISELKRLGINNFVYPLQNFCVGIPNTFLISDIKEKGFIFINRVLDNNSILELEKILKNIPANIMGIIFDDLGVLELVKNLDIIKILYLNHFNTNIESIKIYMEYVDSVVVSSDITKNELEYIINKMPNKLTIMVLGYLQAMYSRRHLISNYQNYHKVKAKNPMKIVNENNEFLVYENEFGTVFYHLPLYNGLELLDLPCQYYLIMNTFLSVKELANILKGKSDLSTDTGFLYQETIYKLKGDSDD